MFGIGSELNVYLFTYTQVQLIDIVKRFETLQNVLLSVTKNIQSILLTAVLAIILIYLYSILGYMFFSNDFMIVTNPMEHFKELKKMGECEAGKREKRKKMSLCYCIVGILPGLLILCQLLFN